MRYVGEMRVGEMRVGELRCRQSENNRPYAIDVITHVTERKTVGGRKSGYYAAILSGKNDRSLRSLSTAEQFASSFLTSTRSDFTFAPRMHKTSTGPNAH